jgi:hypothetical protein
MLTFPSLSFLIITCGLATKSVMDRANPKEKGSLCTGTQKQFDWPQSQFYCCAVTTKRTSSSFITISVEEGVSNQVD